MYAILNLKLHAVLLHFTYNNQSVFIYQINSTKYFNDFTLVLKLLSRSSRYSQSTQN